MRLMDVVKGLLVWAGIVGAIILFLVTCAGTPEPCGYACEWQKRNPNYPAVTDTTTVPPFRPADPNYYDYNDYLG